jgi:hypothetical protein
MDSVLKIDGQTIRFDEAKDRVRIEKFKIK